MSAEPLTREERDDIAKILYAAAGRSDLKSGLTPNQLATRILEADDAARGDQ